MVTALFKPGTKSEDLKTGVDQSVGRVLRDPPGQVKTTELVVQKFNPISGKDVLRYGNVNPKTKNLLLVFNTPTGILDFGTEEMSKIAIHSDAQLDAVKDVDVSFIENQLVSIISLAKSLKLETEPKEEKEHFSLQNIVHKIRSSFIDTKEHAIGEFTNTTAKIDTVVSEVDKAVSRVKAKLDGFEILYSDNIEAYQNLTSLIETAEEALAIKKIDLEEAKANIGKDLLSAEEANRLGNSIIRFEKKIINLKKYQLMAIQNAPEISQMADQALIIIDKFNDIKSMTIPLWKRSIRKYIDSAELRKAALLEQTVNDANNNLLKANSDQNKLNAIDIAKMNNHDSIDDETLETINSNLIQTIIEVQQINQDGVTKREESLKRMNEMKSLYSDIAAGKITTEELKSLPTMPVSTSPMKPVFPKHREIKR